MRSAQNQTKIIQYEDNYLQGFFPDGTSLAWLDDSITYYSLKGNRIKLSLETLKHSEDVCQKLRRILDCQNRYNDEYVDLPQLPNASNGKTVYKKYKIKEYQWSHPIVKQTARGYEVVSDDNNAKFCLSLDLYRIHIQYLQITSNKKISNEQLYLGPKNQRKFLLEKYSFKYNEFPTVAGSNEVEYQYIPVIKQFTIFNLPPRWCPPINFIWGYLLANEIVPHPFCYIDFQEPQNAALASIKETKMPAYRMMQGKNGQKQEERGFQSISYPIYGKPNHNFKFRWMNIFNQQVEIIAYACEGNNIFCENQGFWFIQGAKTIYNSKNKEKTDYEVTLIAFPLTIRFQGQQQRQIKSHIIAFSNYLQHREYVTSKQKNKPVKRVIESQDDIVFEQSIEGVGFFKAFKNQMVKGNFCDRVIVTMKDSQLQVIDTLGKKCIIGSDPLLNSNFAWHIQLISNFYQKVFDAKAYEQRMRLNQLLEERKKLSSIFMKVSKHIQENDY